MEPLHRLSYAIVPGNCVLCTGPTARELDLCEACEADLPVLGPACPCCALPLPGRARCPACSRRSPPFARTWASYPYRAPIDRLIADFKQRGQMTAGRVLADVAARRWLSQSPDVPDLLVPVPLHPTRRRERGFNQAEVIAAHFARRLRSRRIQVGVDPGLVLRVRETADQKSLSEPDRRRNLAGAFRVQRAPPSHVAVIDDVVTTAATVAELSHALRQAGADRVDIIALARTPKPGQSRVW